MFQFNFSVAADDQDGDAVVDDGPSEADVSQSSTSALADPARDPCREVLLTELVSALPTEVAYTLLAFPGTALLLPRRDFHDARLSSLAATADGELAGEELLEEVFDARSDVRPGRYEGGMKTWEGAGDLVGVLRGLQRPWGSVLEIGCGTAIPTLYLLAQVFASESPAQPERETRVCLQDYNRPVLELMTFPNILLTWYLHSPSAAPFRFPHPHPHPHPLSPADPLSLRLEPALVHSFLRSLAHLRLHLSFYAGAWDALSPGVFDMVLTSETIYRPSSLPALARCIQRCLAPSDSSASAAPSTGATPGGRAYVAAKEVYFGVGGSVREFAHVVRGQGMHVQRRWETREGSGRCVLELWRA